MNQAAKDNGVIWSPKLSRGHVESFFMKFNDLEKKVALWIKFTIYCPKSRPGDTVGEVWSIFFDVKNPGNLLGLKESFPIGSCTLSSDPVRIVMGANVFEPPTTKGSLHDADGRTIEWDLSFTEGAPSLHHFPHMNLYKTYLPKIKAKSPHPNSRYHGWFSVNGKKTMVKDVPGMQGHNWGDEHPYHYAWGHCNAFEAEEDAYFEGFTSKVKLGPVVTNYFSLAFLHIDGRLIRFDSPLSWIPRKAEVETNHWSFEIRGRKYDLRGEMKAPNKFFTILPYYNPDGLLNYCINSKISDITLALVDHSSGKVERKLHGMNCAALEVGTKDPKLFQHGFDEGILNKEVFPDQIRLPGGSWGLRSGFRGLGTTAVSRNIAG